MDVQILVSNQGCLKEDQALVVSRQKRLVTKQVSVYRVAICGMLLHREVIQHLCHGVFVMGSRTLWEALTAQSLGFRFWSHGSGFSVLLSEPTVYGSAFKVQGLDNLCINRHM